MSNTLSHNGHDATVVTAEYRPTNVPLTETHEIVRCSCRFFGWLPKAKD